MEFAEIQRIREEHLRLFGGDSRPFHRHNTRSSAKSRNMSVHEAEYYQHADAVRSLASSVLSVRCSGCGYRVSVEKGDILPSFGGQLNELHAYCRSCFASTCLGCNQMLTKRSEKLGNSATSGRHLTWHCDKARTVLIWALLFGYDDQIQRNKQSRKPTARGSKKKATHRGTSGIGYSGDYEDEYYANQYPVDTDAIEKAANSYPFNYHGSNTGNENTTFPAFPYTSGDPNTTQSNIKHKSHASSQNHSDADDKATSELLAALVALFPSSHEQPIPTDFDFTPPAVLISLLTCSSILDRAAELLRNNSLQDVAKRSELYNSLFAFVRILANNGPAMSTILHKPRPIRKSGHDISKISYAAPPHEAMDTAHPLSHCVKDLVRQSEQLLQTAAQHEEYYLDEESQQMLYMCINIREVGELLEKTNNLMQQPQTVSQDPNAWQDGLQVVSVPDEQILSQHHYAKDAQNFSQTARGRMRHLVNDIQILTAGLPRNIFVRYGESRMDVMKVVIAGPVGSPYEHGLFEFDLLCGMEYPQEPPKMFFRTTGGGTVLFNPNLYANGYVCLSLLGTWSGEKWQPGTSTLLQVLVSLQGMVFCEEPWCNEPGRDSARGTEQSKQFNRNLWPNVVKYGMLEWIEGKRSSPPALPPQPGYVNPGIVGAPPVTYTPSSSYISPLPYASPPSYNPSTSHHPTPSYNPHPASAYNPAPYNPAKPPVTSKTEDMFSEIAKKYFEANRKDIMNTVKRWIAEKDRANALLPNPSNPPPPPPPPQYASFLEAMEQDKPPQKKKKKFGDTPQDSFGFRSRATPMPPAKKIDRLPVDATLHQFLTAALEDLNGVVPRGYGAGGTWP